MGATITVSASSSDSRPQGVSMVKPDDVLIGGDSAAQSRKSYHSAPRSDRSTPKTSHGTDISNGATPLHATVTTR